LTVAERIGTPVLKECFGMLDTTDQRQQNEIDQLKKQVEYLQLVTGVKDDSSHNFASGAGNVTNR